ncbi:MAG: YebC/PmpR family DNA-binding transcriptional regulator [bacterium]|nr:YebC/PmpR family DNA-binding transcriptional regulator [bacterium]
MSGHSHWSGIKHKKGIEDAKRAKVFAKMARFIVIAARGKGGNPDMNPALRMAIEKARAANMPADNIERAIKRGTGEGLEETLEGFLYEAFAPGGAAVLIEGITDNKNRTLSEVRKIISDQGGRMAEQGSVQWMFERKGLITLSKDAPENSSSDAEMRIIDAGAEDIRQSDEHINVYTAPDKVMEVKKRLDEVGIKVESAGFDYVPKMLGPAPDEKIKQKLEEFFEALDEHDDVQEIYSNI